MADAQSPTNNKRMMENGGARSARRAQVGRARTIYAKGSQTTENDAFVLALIGVGHGTRSLGRMQETFVEDGSCSKLTIACETVR